MPDPAAASRYFFYNVHVPLLGILNAILWVFIVFRVKKVIQNNRDYPSRWRTASIGSIIFAGLLSTAYFVICIVKLVLNKRLGAIGHRHHIPDDYAGGPSLNITTATFTEAEMDTMIKALSHTGPLIDASRTIITVALWAAKFAFVSSLLASRFCLSRPLRWALYTATVVIVASCGVATWAVSWVMSDGFPPWTPEDVIADQMWLGDNYIFTDIMLESIPTALNLGTDVIVTVIACLVIRSTQVTTGATSLLLLMLSITVVISIARLVVIIEYLNIMQINRPESETEQYFNAVKTNNLSIVSIFVTELEVVICTIVSCLPWMRAWFRGLRSPRSPKPASTLGSDGSMSVDSADVFRKAQLEA